MIAEEPIAQEIDKQMQEQVRLAQEHIQEKDSARKRILTQKTMLLN